MNNENKALVREHLKRTLNFNPKEAGPGGLTLMGLALLTDKLDSIKLSERSMWDDVADFQRMLGMPTFDKSYDFVTELQKFRDGLLKEEHEEYEQAVRKGDRNKQLDALIDMMYVIMGTIILHGWDGAEAWRRVHYANMKKSPGIPGGPGRSAKIPLEYGIVDALKPKGWKSPDHEDLVN